MKLILQFIKPHRWLCAAAVLLLIIDVTGSLIVSTPDFGTDAALRKALASKAKNAAVLITAQRISTIQQADLIIDLHESRTAGNDRHEEPLKTGAGSLRVRGVYTKLETSPQFEPISRFAARAWGVYKIPVHGQRLRLSFLPAAGA